MPADPEKTFDHALSCNGESYTLWPSRPIRSSRRFRGDLGAQFVEDCLAERAEIFRHHHEGSGATDHVVAVVGVEAARRVDVIGISRHRPYGPERVRLLAHTGCVRGEPSRSSMYPLLTRSRHRRPNCFWVARLLIRSPCRRTAGSIAARQARGTWRPCDLSPSRI